LTLKKFSGLPLTILSLLVISNFLLLADFTEEVINSKEFIAIDTQVAQYLFEKRNQGLAKFFFEFTKICSTQGVLLVSIPIAGYLLIKKLYPYFFSLLVTLSGSGISIYLGKRIFEVERPHELAFYSESTFSFPSGHTTIAVAFYGLLFYFAVRHFRSFRVASYSGLVFLCFVFLIGFSRIYLCVHYLSDVLAGSMLGCLWALLGISIFEWMSSRAKPF